MNRDIRVLLIFVILFLPLSLLSQDDKLVVSVEKADIYAEPSARSYRIDTVSRGTVLVLFQKAKVNEIWYYVRFQSLRYGGPAMGFIKDTEVEPFPGVQREPAPPPLPLPETLPPPKTKEKTVPEKKPPEVEEKKAEEKPPEKKTEVPPPPPPVVEPIPEKKAEPAVLTEEFPADTRPQSALVFDPFLTPDEFQDRNWLVSRRENAVTSIPYSRPVQIQAAQASLESRIWEVLRPEPEPLPEPPSPPEKEVAPPVAKPLVKPPAAKEGPPAAWTVPPAAPPAKEGLASDITEYSDKISLSKGQDSFEVRLNYAPYTAYRTFEIPDPNRMVIDFEGVGESAGFFRYRVDELGIAFIRVAMFQDNIARVVLDFSEEIPAYQVEQIDTGIHILFWLTEPASAPEAKVEAIPTPPPQPEPEPEAEPAEAIVEALRETSTPISSRFSLAEPMLPRRERLFLWIEGGAVETVVPRPSLGNLPAYYPPAQESYWEVVQSRPVKAEPRPRANIQDLPPPPPTLETVERKEAEKEPPKTKDIKEEKPEAAADKKEEAKEEDQDIEPTPQITPPAQAPYPQSQLKLPARLTLGLGYGSSTGGLGGFVQYAVQQNLALHGGIGYYPTSLIYSETDWVENQVFWSLGIKYYVPLVSQSVRAYLNAQYGGFTVEAVQVIEGIWDYEFIYRNEQKSLYGPQALLGGEFRLGPLSLNAAAGVAYALTDWEWLPQNLYFTFDLGMLFYLR